MDGVALVVGEALVDVVEAADGSVVERPGGSATNAAVALSRLLRPVLLATSYGPDERGRLLVRAPRRERGGARDRSARRPGHVGGPGPDRRGRCGVVRLRRGVAAGAGQRGGRRGAARVLARAAARPGRRRRRRTGRAAGADDDRDLRPQHPPSHHRHRTRGARARQPAGGTGRPGQGVRRGPGRVVAGSRRGPRDPAPASGRCRQRGGDPRFRRCSLVVGPALRRTRCSSPPTRSTSSTPSVPATPSVRASSMRCGTYLGTRLSELDPEARAAALTHAAACAAVTVSRAGADPPWRAEL